MTNWNENSENEIGRWNLKMKVKLNVHLDKSWAGACVCYVGEKVRRQAKQRQGEQNRGKATTRAPRWKK